MRVFETPMTMPMPASTTAHTAIHCGGKPARLAPYANPRNHDDEPDDEDR